MNSMVGPSEETTNGGAVVAAASPTTVTRNPEVVDFEKLLSDLSTAFIRVAVEEIDREIERWLLRIVLAMDVDRGTVMFIDPVDGTLIVTHQVAREGVVTLDKGSNVRVNYPWYTARILSGELLVLSRLDDAPPEAARDRVVADRDGTKSNVTIPLKVGGVIVGAVSFGAVFFEKNGLKKRSSV